MSNKYNVEIIKHQDISSDWDNFVDNSPQGSVFCKSWWLDAVYSSGLYELLIVEKGGRIQAGMPLLWTSKSKDFISMPVLTQSLGILFSINAEKKYVMQLSDEMEILKIIISNIPSFQSFKINLNYNFNNWLPFYWAGYKQTSRYTYILDNLSEDVVWNGLRPNIRTDIRKAEKQGIIIDKNNDIERFYKINSKTFNRQNRTMSYSLDCIHRINTKCKELENGIILFGKDQDGNDHAAAYIIWDDNSAYYIMGGGDPELRTSGATSLVMWNAIKHVANRTRKFDFEGSMIPSIERFFRAFGGIQKQYFQISKDNRNNFQIIKDRIVNKTVRIINKHY